MSLTPSFYQLYRRSHYSATEPDYDNPTASRQNRAEVFVVAALGFAFRHEPKFLEHLLQNVCRIPNLGAAVDCEIRCQDGFQSDSAIVLPEKQVIVVEAKIGADLQPHQNPTLDEFQTPPAGYGFQIRSNYEKERERHYMVLAKNSLTIPQGRRNCSDPHFLGFRRWGELGGMEDQSRLIADFLECLGFLGIPELRLRSFKNMRLEDTTESAANMFCLLEG